jgi:hypothetical protein
MRALLRMPTIVSPFLKFRFGFGIVHCVAQVFVVLLACPSEASQRTSS